MNDSIPAYNNHSSPPISETMQPAERGHVKSPPLMQILTKDEKFWLLVCLSMNFTERVFVSCSVISMYIYFITHYKEQIQNFINFMNFLCHTGSALRDSL